VPHKGRQICGTEFQASFEHFSRAFRKVVILIRTCHLRPFELRFLPLAPSVVQMSPEAMRDLVVASGLGNRLFDFGAR
jgi:hypothetical protein